MNSEARFEFDLTITKLEQEVKAFGESGRDAAEVLQRLAFVPVDANTPSARWMLDAKQGALAAHVYGRTLVLLLRKIAEDAPEVAGDLVALVRTELEQARADRNIATR